MTIESKLVGTVAGKVELKDALLRKKVVQDILNQMEALSEEDLAEIIDIATFTGKLDPSSIKLYDSLKAAIIKLKIKPITDMSLKIDRRWIAGKPAPDFIYLCIDKQIYALNSVQTKTIEKDLNIRLETANKILSK